MHWCAELYKCSPSGSDDMGDNILSCSPRHGEAIEEPGMVVHPLQLRVQGALGCRRNCGQSCAPLSATKCFWHPVFRGFQWTEALFSHQNSSGWFRINAHTLPRCFGEVSGCGGMKVHEWAKMCAGAKYRARGAPAKTRYCGHYFSRLMRDASKHLQTDRLAYYMRES